MELPVDAHKEYLCNRITFWLNGQQVTSDIPPAQTTLEYLLQNVSLFGTKCSCNEGDCGACTVVIADVLDAEVHYAAVNSCLYTAAKLQGKHLITIEGLGTPEHLHPIQQAMLDFHATQCGYCSPGFVMSMFALFASQLQPSEETILAALEGNLCRCTGYESILNAARWLASSITPAEVVPAWCREVEAQLMQEVTSSVVKSTTDRLYPSQRYHLPSSLHDLDALLAEEADFVLINGGTDIMVQMNVLRRKYPVLIDLSGVAELQGIRQSDEVLSIGAAATYSQISDSAFVQGNLPCLVELISQIASKQIRNFGTLAGNVANASPIGDSLPLLLVLDAYLTLYSASGERVIALADFFLDYRKTALKPREIIKAVHIPIADSPAFIRFQKSAKRKAVDISSVVSAVFIREENGIVRQARLALGGVAAVPRLSRKFHNAMHNMELTGLHLPEIAQYVASEFTPISDVRGSNEYRSLLIRNHVLKYLQDFMQGRHI